MTAEASRPPLYTLAGAYTGRTLSTGVSLAGVVQELERDYPGRWDLDALEAQLRRLDVREHWTSHHGARGVRVTRTA